jgi:hypothetical protein
MSLVCALFCGALFCVLFCGALVCALFCGALFCALVRAGVEIKEGTESSSRCLDQLEETIRRQSKADKLAALALAKARLLLPSRPCADDRQELAWPNWSVNKPPMSRYAFFESQHAA